MTCIGEPTSLDLGMELGECPTWDWRTKRLYWVDIIKCELFCLEWGETTPMRWPLPALGGGLCLAQNDRLLVCCQTGIFAFHPETETWDLVTSALPDKPHLRLNEAKTSPQGELFIGTMATQRRAPEGALYRVRKSLEVDLLIPDVAVPNGLTFLSQDTFLFADSHLQTVSRYKVQNGQKTARREATFANDRNETYIPDGAALSTADHYVNAKFGGGKVVFYHPHGRVSDVLHLPVSQVTSCAFCGPDMDHLAITTAKRLLNKIDRQKQTQAGDLFLVKTELNGCPEPVAEL